MNSRESASAMINWAIAFTCFLWSCADGTLEGGSGCTIEDASTPLKVRRAVYSSAGACSYIGLEVQSLREYLFRRLLRKVADYSEESVILFVRLPASGKVVRCKQDKPCQIYGAIFHEGQYHLIGPLQGVASARGKSGGLRLQLILSIPPAPRIGGRLRGVFPEIKVKADRQALLEMLEPAALPANPDLVAWLTEIKASMTAAGATSR